ncbi:MAG TPA: DNA-processing protein DprA [Solirubrobacterales bacterium]|nr:DNA-processing protein DprA [Solirubrobacterales bacterium]
MNENAITTTDHHPRACLDCLRRAWLLAGLGPYLEQLAGSGSWDEVPDPTRITKLLRLSNENLVAAAAPNVASQVLARIEALSEDRLHEELALADCWACCPHGDGYPSGLRDAGADAPRALTGRGRAELLEILNPDFAVTVVGARRATADGRGISLELGRDLADAGRFVVSRLDFGIDSCVHRGALDGGAERTVAFLGCGPDMSYPASLREVWRQVCDAGLVLSELPPGATPWSWSLAAGHRIMAALAGITVLVEEACPAERWAEILPVAEGFGRRAAAVPGPIRSRSASEGNSALAGGAHAIRCAEDVLELMQ